MITRCDLRRGKHQLVEDSGQVFIKIWHWSIYSPTEYYLKLEVKVKVRRVRSISWWRTLARFSSEFWHWSIYSPTGYQHLSHLNLILNLNLVPNLLSITVNWSFMHRFKHTCPSNLYWRPFGRGFMKSFV